MQAPWKTLAKPELIHIISPEGSKRCSVNGYFSGAVIIIDDMSADIAAGDEILRKLPNGKEQAFLVVNPKYVASGPFGPHYQVKIEPQGSRKPQEGGARYITVNGGINLSGDHARVNIDSEDSSVNGEVSGDVFQQLRDSLNASEVGGNDLKPLMKRIDAMEAADDKTDFSTEYRKFIGDLANHVTIVAPLLPALATMWA